MTEAEISGASAVSCRCGVSRCWLFVASAVFATACAADEPSAGGPHDPPASADGSSTSAPSTAPSDEVDDHSQDMGTSTETPPSVDPAPTGVAPTGVAPTSVAPTSVAPTSVAPTSVAPTSVAPTNVAPTSVAPTTGGVSDAGRDDSSGATAHDAGPGTPEDVVVYVGGFDYEGDSYPFTIYDLDAATGELSARAATVDAGANPSYVTVSGGFMYVANERDDSLGGLTALSIATDGSLTRLNHQSGSDGGFTYVAVDPQGRFALGASYNGGSVSLFPIEQDGRLGPELQTVDFGANAQSHCVGFDTLGNYVLVPNKGADEVAQLVLSPQGNLTPNTPASVAAPNGSGPRHLAVSPDGTRVWTINELASSLTTYQLNTAGTLTSSSTVSTLPEGYNGQNTGAHVEVSADGRFVYASNRGHNTIAVFAVDASDGSLTLIEHEPTGGSTPRDFDLDSVGGVAVVANQDSNTLMLFAVQQDGSLEPMATPIAGPPSPAAVQILYLP